MIYLIDDDKSVRGALERLMKSAQLPVKTYASGQEFVDSVLPGESDCVIFDASAPSVNGMELLRHFHEHNVDAQLILLTRDDDEETRAQARRLGATGCFVKPVDGQALLDAIRFSLTSRGC